MKILLFFFTHFLLNSCNSANPTVDNSGVHHSHGGSSVKHSKSLLPVADATGCEKVYLTHGYTATFSRYLTEIGFDAQEVYTLYGGEEEETVAAENTEDDKVLPVEENLGGTA